MNIKEFLDLLKTEEGKAIIPEIAKEFGLLRKEDVDGLEKKKNEILAEKKALQAKFKAFENLTEDDIAEYQALKEKAASMTTDVESVKKQNLKEIEALRKKLADTEALNSSLTKKINDYTISSSIEKVFSAANVSPKHREMLATAWRAMAQLEAEENGNSIVKIAHNGQSLPIEEFAKSFFTSDNGKEYTAAPLNVGGGARGTLPGSGRKLSLADIEKISDRGERMKALEEAGYTQRGVN